MKKWKAYCFLLLVSALFFTSCATKVQTVEVEVPVPVKIDIADIAEPVLALRPDNSQIKVNAGPILDIYDILENQAACLQAWELWENYADALEKTIFAIQEKMDNI